MNRKEPMGELHTGFSADLRDGTFIAERGTNLLYEI